VTNFIVGCNKELYALNVLQPLGATISVIWQFSSTLSLYKLYYSESCCGCGFLYLESQRIKLRKVLDDKSSLLENTAKLTHPNQLKMSKLIQLY